MKEDACIFFCLLNESYKINAEERLEGISCLMIPHVKPKDSKEIINGYRTLLIDKSDLKLDTNYDNIQKLKKIL